VCVCVCVCVHRDGISGEQCQRQPARACYSNNDDVIIRLSMRLLRRKSAQPPRYTTVTTSVGQLAVSAARQYACCPSDKWGRCSPHIHGGAERAIHLPLFVRPTGTEIYLQWVGGGVGVTGVQRTRAGVDGAGKRQAGSGVGAGEGGAG